MAVTRLINAAGDEIKKMTAQDLKAAIYKSEGRVIMGQHLLFAGPGLVRGITNSELMFAFGADIHAIGDGGFGGCTAPENIHQLSISIKGRQYTYFRMGSVNR